MIHIRPYVSADREFVLGLAPRLAIGIPYWRDQSIWIETARGWIKESIEQHGEKTMVFVAEDKGSRFERLDCKRVWLNH